jgi:hypothetical protein
MRTCARPGCNEAAGATLSYDYAARTVWLDHRALEDHPMSHDLCAAHADRLRVPVGWSLQDRRGTLPLLRSSLAS